MAWKSRCTNVIQHAGAGQEYQVQVSARDGRCAIEVINAGHWDGMPAPDGSPPGTGGDGRGPARERAGEVALTGEPVPSTAEHGRGLKIIDAVADNLQLTANERHGTAVHFEKTLQWQLGAPGQRLLNGGGGP
jgi:serine/threonine-protein kinase RsbW